MYRHIHPELKKAIIDWYFGNTDLFNRLNGCIEYFQDYIYDLNGNYLIGGEDVYNFCKTMVEII